MKVTGNKSGYTVQFGTFERHFLTLWQLIAFLSNINQEVQKN